MVEMSKEGYVFTLGPGPGLAGWGSVDAAGTHTVQLLSAQGLIWPLFHWPSLPGDARGPAGNPHWLAFPPIPSPNGARSLTP